MFPSQMFKSGKAKIWFFGERSDWTDALKTGSNVDPLVPPLAPRMSKQTRLTEAGMPQRLQDANDDQEIEGFLYQVIAVLKV